MQMEKGIGFCGLACCVCGQNNECAGCRNEGCTDKQWCKNRSCCRQKGLEGCWECSEFPCRGGMLDKMRIRAFAKFIKQYGVQKLMERLEKNEHAGIIYHYDGQIIGDYDILLTEEEIIGKLLHGIEK